MKYKLISCRADFAVEDVGTMSNGVGATFVPDSLVVHVTDDDKLTVKALGPPIRKDGGIAKSRTSFHLTDRQWPVWVAKIMREVYDVGEGDS